jgi:hypothetical protein
LRPKATTPSPGSVGTVGTTTVVGGRGTALLGAARAPPAVPAITAEATAPTTRERPSRPRPRRAEEPTDEPAEGATEHLTDVRLRLTEKNLAVTQCNWQRDDGEPLLDR